MPIFTVEEDATPEATKLARGILKAGNQIADQLVSMHRQSRAMLFNRSDITTVAELQAIVDAMGDQAPTLFAKSRALATFLDTEYPGALAPEELEPLVAYTLEDGRSPQPIVFDPNAEYPGA